MKNTRSKTNSHYPQFTKSMDVLKAFVTRCIVRNSLFGVALTLTASLVLSTDVVAVCRQGCGGISDTFLGESALQSDSGIGNTAVGANSMSAATSGNYNSAFGLDALFHNSSGSSNTANGTFALWNNTTGSALTAIGYAALELNTESSDNTAVGAYALQYNTGSKNTATGRNALNWNTSGVYNTADGYAALFLNTTGANNTAIGFGTLTGYAAGSGPAFTSSANTALGAGALGQLGTFDSGTWDNNTALGAFALVNAKTGSNNTATGAYAMAGDLTFAYATSTNNTANGAFALQNVTTGGNNLAEGYNSLLNNTTGTNNVASGSQALLNNTTGSSNIALGESAGRNLTTGSNNIDIGHKGTAGESKTIRIGTQGTQTKTVISGIYGATVAGGIGVLIDSNGRLGTTTSSARYKDNIQPMDKASEAILLLQPVSFRYKKELDPKAIPQFGLVAEQVEKVNPDLVARNDEGKPYSVRYEAVNAMLLNEFLKEHRKGLEQDATISELKSVVVQQQEAIKALSRALEEQAAQIQKVSDQFTAEKAAPRMVLNDLISRN